MTITMTPLEEVSSYHKEGLSQPETISKQPHHMSALLKKDITASGFVLNCPSAALLPNTFHRKT
jgi:hypothetical protein